MLLAIYQSRRSGRCDYDPISQFRAGHDSPDSTRQICEMPPLAVNRRRADRNQERHTMAKPKLDKMSVPELRTLLADVDVALKDAEKRDRANALAAAKAAAAEHGFSLTDLFGDGKKAAKAIAPPKYKHPENPAKTWSGRGRQPEWIKEGLAAGRALEDFLI